MSAIIADKLTFSYPSSYDNIFENVSFQIDTDWKLGFVGRNGRGKTTFLKLLMGEYDYGGRITSSVKFDYFPYDVRDKSIITEDVLGEVCPEAEQWEIMKELSLMDIDEGVLWRPFDTLSGGEQTKVLLAALFLNEEHFLLIDEPTNHLDGEARKKVADYLNRKKGFILVSHDRRFLDGCVDHILSINRTNIEVQSGNFSSWYENFSRQQNFEETENERLKKDIERLRKAAGRTGTWSDRVEASKRGAADKGYVGHKSAKMMKRSKSIEARRTKAAEEKSTLLKNVEKAEELKIHPLIHRSDTLAVFSDVAPVYGGTEVCSPVNFEIHCGDRLFIDGRNGSGKSSLLKLLAGDDTEHRGKVDRASGLVISYVPQNAGELKGYLPDFARERGIDVSLFMTILRKMDFERVQFEKRMDDYSAGQKKKVLLAKSLCEKAHLYIWDEPLNYIDIYSRMQIEQLIRDFSPTMLLVEHDGAFRDAVATGVIKL